MLLPGSESIKAGVNRERVEILRLGCNAALCLVLTYFEFP